jgi:tRNA (mo5U34)-methyltransferase
VNSDFNKLKDRLTELGWYHSIELPGGETIPGLQSPDQLRHRLAQFPIPGDLRGKRVLDIGAWDGWFSFEMERRGTKVVAMDNAEHHRFKEAAALLGSSVAHITADICRVGARDLGTFDYVLFFGVLYHLKHPLLALENVCGLATEAAFVESYVCDPNPEPARPPYMEFYEGEELLGQFDNWVGPNIPCLLAMCRTAGFARVEFQSVLANRAHVCCYRKWQPLPQITSADLVIVSVENTFDRSSRFNGHTDEYLSIWFKSDEGLLTLETVFPVIGPYGARAVHLSKVGSGGYLINCKLPPGLPNGSNTVTLATPRGASANQASVWVGEKRLDMHSAQADKTKPIRIQTVADGLTWLRGQVSITARGGFLSVWAENVEPGIAREKVAIRSGHRLCTASFLSARLPDGLTQMNFPIPPNFPTGPAAFTLLIDGHPSDPFEIQVLRAPGDSHS